MATASAAAAETIVGMCDSEVDPGVVVQHLGEAKGRGLVALRDFRKGETLFKEKPFASAQLSWNRSAGYDSCQQCLEPLETAQENVLRLTGDHSLILPYTESCCPARRSFHVACRACGAPYCSETCLGEAAEAHHRLLCPGSNPPDPSHPVVRLEEAWKAIHHPPETATIMLAARMLATLAQSSAGLEGAAENAPGFRLLSLVHKVREDEACLKLLDPNNQLQHRAQPMGQVLEGLRQDLERVFAGVAGFDRVQWFLTPEGFTSLLALMARNAQGIGTSPFAGWVKKAEKQRLTPGEAGDLDALISKVYEAVEAFAGMQFINNEGAGVYLLQSMANHSCAPNAEVAFPFNNHLLVLNATGPIAAGEEITISYLDECDRERSRHSRNKILLQNYLFTCTCPKCAAQAGDLDLTSDEDMSSGDDDDDADEDDDDP